MMALRLLGWLRGLIGSLGQFIRRDPKLALCLLLAAFGLWERHQAAKWRDRAEQYQTASQAATAATKALRAAERDTYVEQAKAADAGHADKLDRAHDLTLQFIHARRVQPARSCPAAQPVSQADPAAVPESVPTGVVVDSADVQACGDLYAYSTAAREWALTIGQ